MEIQVQARFLPDTSAAKGICVPLENKATASERETDLVKVFTVAWRIRWHYLIGTYSFTVLLWGEQFNRRQMLRLSQAPDTALKTHTLAIIFIWINCALSLKNNPQLSKLPPHVFLPLTVALSLLYSMPQLQILRAGLFISGQRK